MSQRIFQQSIVIAAAPEAVYPFFATMANHTTLHPLIIAIHELPPRDDAGTRWYRITDRIGSGRLAFSFSYTAAVRALDATTLLSEAFQFPRIHLRNTTRCLPDRGGTRVEEHVEIMAPWILMPYVLKQTQAAHTQLLLRLKQQLEAAALK